MEPITTNENQNLLLKKNKPQERNSLFWSLLNVPLISIDEMPHRHHLTECSFFNGLNSIEN